MKAIALEWLRQPVAPGRFVTDLASNGDSCLATISLFRNKTGNHGPCFHGPSGSRSDAAHLMNG